jgi:hypothetical protein
MTSAVVINAVSRGDPLDGSASATFLEVLVFRITMDGNGLIVEVARVHEIEQVIRAGGVGRYRIDEISVDPLSGGRTSRPWGIAIKRMDGAVIVQPEPPPD